VDSPAFLDNALSADHACLFRRACRRRKERRLEVETHTSIHLPSKEKKAKEAHCRGRRAYPIEQCSYSAITNQTSVHHGLVKEAWSLKVQPRHVEF
jgi:hypothetical protein